MRYLAARAAILRAVRAFFVEQGYLEVETPVRLPAIIPERYIEPEESSGWFLQTSPELCMKRLLAAGHGKIFQICKCFRRSERGSLHLPEFTMLEWYRAGGDYRDLMAECAGMLCFVAAHLDFPLPPSTRLLVNERDWEHLTVARAFALHAPVSLEEALRRDIFDEILVQYIEPHLGREKPTFLHDYPAQLGALARLKKDDPSLAERFELYIHGIELANGFSELTDAVEQQQRFVKEQALIVLQGRHPGPMPEKFLADLPVIESAAGIALGVDRLVMLLCGATSIDEVVCFSPETL